LPGQAICKRLQYKIIGREKGLK